MLNHKIKIAITSLFVICMVFIVGCGANDSSASDENGDQKKKIKIANVYDGDHSVNVALKEKFKPIVEEKGNFEVEIYGNNQLGDEKEFLSSARSGSIQMAVNGTIMSDMIPLIEVPTLPFLLNSFEDAKKVLNGEIGEKIASDFEEKLDMHFLGYGTTGFRNFTSNRPINKLEDFKGLKVRMADGYPILMKTAEAIGTSVTPLDFSETFTAIETGVVDGQENPVSTTISAKLYEVQDYMIETRHNFSLQIFHMSKKFWDTLDEEEQAIIEEATQETTDYQWKLMQESEEENMNFVKEEGMEIITPDSQFRKNLEEAVEPVYDYYYESVPEAEAIVEEIKNELK